LSVVSNDADPVGDLLRMLQIISNKATSPQAFQSPRARLITKELFRRVEICVNKLTSESRFPRFRDSREDIVQEVMTRIVRRVDTFEGSRSKGSTWVYSVTRNYLIDQTRKTNKDPMAKHQRQRGMIDETGEELSPLEFLGDDEGFAPQRGIASDELLALQDQLLKAKEHICSQPGQEEHFEAWVLRDGEGLSIPEIATMQFGKEYTGGSSKEQKKIHDLLSQRIRRIRLNLRIFMDQHGG
jgi:RNA polymerase sigma factor (sigma-70 family)